jgi:hypothetical protein
MISALLTLFIVGIVSLMVLSVVFAVVGIAVGLLFKIIPVLLVGYVVLRLIGPKRRQLSAEDRKWLES